MNNAQGSYKIAAFYEFKDMAAVGDLADLKVRLKEAMTASRVFGTILLAKEGYNGMISGEPEPLDSFLHAAAGLLETSIRAKFSFHRTPPFRKTEVRVKPEIVTLRQQVDMCLAAGTHVTSAE